MKNIKTFSLTLLTAGVFVLSTVPVNAASQYGQYGGTTPPTPVTSTVIIDKKVSYGETNKSGAMNYVDNYSPSDARLKPGQQVYFQIKVKNTSNVQLTNVVVRDYVPANVEPVEGPGSYDANTRIITVTYPVLQPGEERVERVIMQVNGQDRLPADKGLSCLTNKAEVRTGNMSAADTAQFCYEKEVVGVSKAPAAGPEYGIALVALQMAGLGAGVFLKKKLS